MNYSRLDGPQAESNIAGRNSNKLKYIEDTTLMAESEEALQSFLTKVLEKTLESPLDGKEIKPVDSKGNQPWIFIRRTDAEALIIWPSDAKNQRIGKDHDLGKDWRQ